MADGSDTPSDLVLISRLNGDFKRNYGPLLGAFLYLRSLAATRGTTYFWNGLAVTIVSAVLSWFGQHGWKWPF
jgi:hypothetical protein